MDHLKRLWGLIISDGSKYVISTSILLLSLPILMTLLLLLLFCGEGITDLMETVLTWLL